MTLRASLGVLGLCALLAFVVSFIVSASAETQAADPTAIPVDWAERPSSVGDLVGDADIIVEAEVIAVDGGEPLEGDVAADDIPTQRITFSLISVVDGNAESIESEFVLFKTGSDEQYLEGDPPYVVGERYVLFLRPWTGEEGTWINGAPDGRIRLDETPPADPQPEEAVLFIEGDVKEQLKGSSLADIEAEVAQ